jgi:hypothetical protein
MTLVGHCWRCQNRQLPGESRHSFKANALKVHFDFFLMQGKQSNLMQVLCMHLILLKVELFDLMQLLLYIETAQSRAVRLDAVIKQSWAVRLHALIKLLKRLKAELFDFLCLLYMLKVQLFNLMQLLLCSSFTCTTTAWSRAVWLWAVPSHNNCLKSSHSTLSVSKSSCSTWCSYYYMLELLKVELLDFMQL